MKRIIVVDDDSSMQDIVKLILERAGYQVTIFADAVPLLENAFELPDIFILDKLLSGMDGTDVCLFLKNREDTKNIPVIMLSALPDIEEHMREAGADDFLEKPFSIKELLTTIGKYN
jgi:DNA-binding response OmpR family regulator